MELLPARNGTGFIGWLKLVFLSDSDATFKEHGAVSYYDEPYPAESGTWGWSRERGSHRLPPDLFARYYFNADNLEIGYFLYGLSNAMFFEKFREWYDVPELKSLSA